jgi:anaerobic selenocysteine-containing dehydrogenase
MHELIVHGWLDQDYIDRYTLGWEPLRERALQWPPERAAEVCGVPAEQIRRLARDWGTTQPAAIRLNYGMQRVRGGGNAVRAIACLPALVGAWRHRAGVCCCSSGRFPVRQRGPAAARPAGAAAAAHHQHEHHRRRPAAPGVARVRPAD